MKPFTFVLALAAAISFAAGLAAPAGAQQFNSDNYLSKPHGVATIIATFGQRNDILMSTLSAFPSWEFTVAVYTYHHERDQKTSEGYSTSYYFKYMFYENPAKTGGFAIKAGTGLEPGYLLNGVGLTDAFQTYWTNLPVTLPFLDNKLSWDLMPGASVTFDYGEDKRTAPSFTYSTRLAWYPVSPTLALVGEVFGSEGDTRAPAEYRVGPRWEPTQYANLALTYGQKFQGSGGSEFEFGIMLFTPPFVKLGKSKD